MIPKKLSHRQQRKRSLKIAFAISNFDSEDANAEMTALYLDWARIPSLLGHDVTLNTLSEKGYSEDVMNGVKVVRFPFESGVIQRT